jgi:putative ABC transport system ATP-binding protein
LDGSDLTKLDEDARARLRGKKVGFIFQSFQLIPTLTAQENVQVPLELQGRSDATERATDLLTRVGLGDRLDHFPTQLSGGEQQRTAIARALLQEPDIYLADEPVANLDSYLTGRVLGILRQEASQRGRTVFCVLHNAELVERFADVVLSFNPVSEGAWNLRPVIR